MEVSASFRDHQPRHLNGCENTDTRSRTNTRTLSDDDVDLPLVPGAERLVDGVAAAEDLGLVLALRVVLADGLDILLEVVAEGEPDGGDLLLQDGGDARVLRRFGHVQDPAEEANTNGQWGILRNFQGLARGLEVFLQLLRGVKACKSALISQSWRGRRRKKAYLRRSDHNRPCQ